MRIHFSVISVLILFIVEGCANKPNSTVDIPVDNSVRGNSKERIGQKVRPETESASIEHGKVPNSSIILDQNSTSGIDVISPVHPKGEHSPEEFMPLITEDKSQTVNLDKIEDIPDFERDNIFKEMNAKITHSSSLPKDRPETSGDFELQSYFQAKIETMDSNKTDNINAVSQGENDVVIESQVKLKLDSLSTKSHNLENNYSNEMNLGGVDDFRPKLDNSGSTLSINSDSPTENIKIIEPEFSNKEKVIIDDQHSIQAGFISSNSTLEGMRNQEQAQGKVGFRDLKQTNDLSPLPRHSISFLDESRKGERVTEISSESEMVSFKNIPISRENEIRESNREVAFRVNNKTLIQADNQVVKRVAFADAIANTSHPPLPKPSLSDTEFSVEKELEYGKLKSFLRRNGAKGGSVVNFDKKQFSNARGYLDTVREEDEDSVSSEEKSKRKSRFLKTLEWIENRGRVQEDLILE
jgi:hypothetical protein